MKRLIAVSTLAVALSFSLVNCQNKNVSSADGDSGSSSGLRSVYFDFDNSFIRNDQVSVLQSNGAYLKSVSGTVSVEGHCDERGTNEYNMALGQRRSEATRTYLTSLGVNSENLRTVSYGEEKPVCSESDESCWAKNRRVDFRK